MAQADWAWWAGRDDEWMTIGPCATKEDAIAEFIDEQGGGEGDGIVMECVMETFRFDAQSMVERFLDDWADDTERWSSEHSPPELHGSTEDKKAAIADLQVVMDAWQARWSRILPEPNMFSCTRNSETICNTVDPDMLPGGHDNPRDAS